MLIALFILLGIYLLISCINIIYIVKTRHRLDDISNFLFFLFIGVIPLINITFLSIMIDEVDKEKKKKRMELKELNTFSECNSCKMIVRKGYTKKSICPICEEVTSFEDYKEKYVPSNDIYFQKEIIDAKVLEDELLIDKTNEQNALYLEIMQKKLKNKKQEN